MLAHMNDTLEEQEGATTFLVQKLTTLLDEFSKWDNAFLRTSGYLCGERSSCMIHIALSFKVYHQLPCTNNLPLEVATREATFGLTQKRKMQKKLFHFWSLLWLYDIESSKHKTAQSRFI